MNVRFVVVFISMVSLNNCVHSQANLATDLVTADAKCNARQFDSATAKVDCYSQVEYPVVQRDIPFAANAYSIFEEKRSHAAGEFDRRTGPAHVAWKRFFDDTQQAAAVLITHEPGFGDQNGKLRKDLNVENIGTVCQQTQLTGRMTCFGEIMRPIWERDAPSTLPYYDEFQSKRMQFARAHDAVLTRAGISAAVGQYKAQISHALAEFRADATRALQAAQQQAADQQAAARARAAEAADRLANFIGELLVGAAEGVAIAAEARAAAGAAPVSSPSRPVNCISNQIGSYTYTNCY